MSSPDERQSELKELLNMIGKSVDRDIAREKARLNEVYKSEIA
jgi:hypothetical protein